MPALIIILLTLGATVTFMSAPSSVQTGTIMLMTIYLGTIAAAFWLDRKRT